MARSTKNKGTSDTQSPHNLNHGDESGHEEDGNQSKQKKKKKLYNSRVLNNGELYKIQKIRQRKILSCIPCHQRKIKCSRETPVCANCQKFAQKSKNRGAEILAACSYFVNDKKKNLKKTDTSLLKEVINIHSEVNNSTTKSSEKQKKNVSTGQDKVLSSYEQEKGGYEGEGEVEEDEEHDEEENYEAEEAGDEYDNSDYQNQSSEGNDQDNGIEVKQTEDTETYTPLYLADHSLEEQVQYEYEINTEENNSGTEPEQRQGEFKSQKTSEMNSEVQVQRRQGMNQEEENGNRDYTQQLPQHHQEGAPALMTKEERRKLKRANQYLKKFDEFINSMPQKARSDELMINYMKSINPLLPLIDMIAFKKSYEDFWYCGLYLRHNIEKLYYYYTYGNSQDNEDINNFLYWYNKSNCLLNPSNLLEFYQTLYVVYYSSASALCYQLPPDQNGLLRDEINHYYLLIKFFNRKMLDNPRQMTLTILQLNIIIQSISNLKNGRSLTNSVKLLRICQFYQLNRDPVIYHNLNDPEVVQSRRIVWWQIFLLDNLISFFLNVPPIIRLDQFDTSLPIENLNGNLVSLKLNCSSLRDDSSMGDSGHPSNYFNYCILFFNSTLRFSIVVNSIINLTNGLNRSLKFNDINDLKNKINDLYISCHSSRLNLDRILQSKLSDTSFNSPEEIAFISYCNLMLQVLPDKALIILQKKILTTSYDSFFDNQPKFGSYPNAALNLSLNSKLDGTVTYNYKDLSNNLLPSILHYLNVFLLLSDESMSCFNWKVKNFIPIDELILLMTILVTNFQSNKASDEPKSEMPIPDKLIADLRLKIHLIGETIRILRVNWQRKLSSLNKLIGIVSNIWSLMQLKYKSEFDYVLQSSGHVYAVPVPAFTHVDPTGNSPSQQKVYGQESPTSDISSSSIAHHEDYLSQRGPSYPRQQSSRDVFQALQNQHQYKQVQEKEQETKELQQLQVTPKLERNQSQNGQATVYPNSQIQGNNTVSCVEIAPRTMSAASSSYRQPFSINVNSAHQLNNSFQINESLQVAPTPASILPNKQTAYDLKPASLEESTSSMSMTTPLFGNISTYRSITLKNGEVSVLSDADNYPMNNEVAHKGFPTRMSTTVDAGYQSQQLASQGTAVQPVHHTPSSVSSPDSTANTAITGYTANSVASETVQDAIEKLVFDIEKECTEENDNPRKRKADNRDQNYYNSLEEDEFEDDEEVLDEDEGGLGSGFEDENQQGWYNLGTGAIEDLKKDDFHFYKGLKNDVINLFKLIIA